MLLSLLLDQSKMIVCQWKESDEKYGRLYFYSVIVALRCVSYAMDVYLSC